MLSFFEDSTNNETTENSENNGNGNGGILPAMLENWKNYFLMSLLLTCSLCYLLLRELLQFISSPLHYVTSPENWIELVLIGLTAGVILNAGTAIGAVVIILATWELIILVGQHPRTSISIEIFQRVTVTFIKFLLPYFVLILAFALTFHVLFEGDKENQNFLDPVKSLFKTIIMLTGELDSGDLPFSNFPVVSRLVFIGFIVLIVIILLNLLTGLAVSDIAEILAEAELVCLSSRTQLVAYAERLAVGSPRSLNPRLCCCLNWLPCESLSSRPARFLARRVLLFPRFLPHAKLSVKPFKNYEFTMHDSSSGASGGGWWRCWSQFMDPVVALRAKEILAQRGRESTEDRMEARLEDSSRRIEGLEVMLRDVVLAERDREAREKRIEAQVNLAVERLEGLETAVREIVEVLRSTGENVGGDEDES